MAAIVLTLICTYLVCGGIILTQWIIAHVGVVIFAVILAVSSLIFLAWMGDEEDER